MIAIMPLVHPAAILRGQWEQDPLQVEFLRRAKEYVNGNIEPIDISTVPDNANLYPTLQDLKAWELRCDLSRGIAIDIESAGKHVICVGLLSLDDFSYICVRFKLQGGVNYWGTWWDTYRAVEWLDRILSQPEIPKHFHNGQAFDVPELSILGFRLPTRGPRQAEASVPCVPEPFGFIVRGFGSHPDSLDTMLVQSTALSGFPKGLAQCATYHLGMPSWKQLVKEDDETQGKS